MTGKLNFISAGAGSGKTYRLTQILHEHLSSGAVRASGVIATTFTRKAATELRERVRSHLIRQGAHHLANAMGQARIGTVNSVCGGLLQRFAFEAGLATEQQVLEEAQAALLVRHAIDAVLDGPSVAELIQITRRLGIDDWRDVLGNLLGKARANDIAPSALSGFARQNAEDLLSHFPAPAKQDISALLLQAIETGMPQLNAAIEVKQVKKTIAYRDLTGALARSLKNGSAAWSDWVKLSKELPEVGLKPVAEGINEVAARYAEHPQLHTDLAGYLERMFDLCARALQAYDVRKREMGVLDFTDQEHLLLKTLDNPAVADTLAAELDLLLVDEFQDTSPIQLALFVKLAGFAKAVYWVGDIKQAIYGFRGSDTELMEAILEALPGMGGEKEILGSSWRSRPPLVKLVNEIFSSAFADSLSPEEVVLKPERTDSLGNAAVANWILAGSNKELQFSSLASGIRTLIDSGHVVFDKEAKADRKVTFGDVVILCRSNDGVKALAAGLRMAGIPTATSQPGLLATPEAVLAMACLRRLNDPSDTIATAEILSLANSTEPEAWVAQRLQHLAVGGDADLWMEAGTVTDPLVVQLAGLRVSLPLLAPREALQTVIAECDLSARVLRWTQSADVARIRLANLEKLLALADTYEDICRGAQHAASISGLILWFGEQEKNEQDSLADPAIDAVKVMTHHAAKGLEWPVVILTDLHAKVQDRLWGISVGSASGIEVSDPLKDRYIRYWPWPFGKQEKLSLADEIALTSTAQTFSAAAIEENKRLLYVSMTRARDLMILARLEKKPSGEWIDTLGAAWLLPDGEVSDIDLPSGGTIEALRWPLTPIDGIVGEAPSEVHWFPPPIAKTSRLPLIFNPSAAVTPACRVVEKIPLGERISVASGTDMAALGTAIHACIATAFADRDVPLGLKDVDALLDGLDAGKSVTAKAVLSQIEILKAWISGRWRDARAHAEIPVEALLDTGQILQGRIDLLLETSEGWVLIDHKSSQLGAEHWDELAVEHAGQLAAYAAAVERATQRPVVESWLFLPVAGRGPTGG